MHYFCNKFEALKYLITALVISLYLVSCGPKVIYTHKVDIKQPWDYFSPVTFEYEITDTIEAYDLQLSVVHADNFTFENMYVNATTIFPDGKKITRPVSLQLANSNGDWLGTCSGDHCTIQIPISTGAYYKSTGKYSLIFDQYSRKGNLEGIQSLEMEITAHTTEK